MNIAAERSQKDTRVVARVDLETQRFIAQAAELSGMSVSQFLIDAARSKAEEIVDRTARIRVSAEMGNRMLDILDRKPRKPSSKLLANALDYRESVDDTETDNNPTET